MASTKFVTVRPAATTLSGLLDYISQIQRNVVDFAAQLEDARRGVLAVPGRILTASDTLAEDSIVSFTGKGPAVVALAPASVRGRGRGMVVVLQHAGQGLLSLVPSGSDTLNGLAKPLVVLAGEAVVAVSDGISRWQTLTGNDGRDWNSYKHAPGGSGLTAWFIAGVSNSTAMGPGVVAINVLRAFPFVAPRRGGVLDTVAFNVTTAVAGNGRVGVFDNAGEDNLYPTKLLADGGSISTGTTGVKSAPVSVPLRPGGLYWLAHVCSAAATLSSISNTNMSTLLGVPPTFGGGAPSLGIGVAFAFAALTDFPAGGTYLTSASLLPALAGQIS